MTKVKDISELLSFCQYISENYKIHSIHIQQAFKQSIVQKF